MERKEGGKKERRKWGKKEGGKGEKKKKGCLRMSALRNQESMVPSTPSPSWGGPGGGGIRIPTDVPTYGCPDEAGLP